ncbi:hypothetical protein B0H10DRAFT_2243630 [Mycena sp. CBHHK59/15]|nr:hypothetical protein B0H10DRAFT_2243630 [Mycena sp. CBHHK59/15]
MLVLSWMSPQSQPQNQSSAVVAGPKDLETRYNDLEALHLLPPSPVVALAELGTCNVLEQRLVSMTSHKSSGQSAVLQSSHLLDLSLLTLKNESTQPIPEIINAPSDKPPAVVSPDSDSILDDPSTVILPGDTEGDVDSDLLNDGVGVGDDDEESDNEERGDDHPDPAHADHPRPRRTARKLPKWLQSQFDTKVNESKVRGEDGLPALYRDHKTMWFPVEDPYFATRDHDSLAPEKLYHAAFFLWDPAALVAPNRIACPNCKAGLTRAGHIPRPRRCVDLDQCFYIIGYRYRCPTCVNPKSGKSTITFRSWDSRILKKLPRALAAAFPAMLTYRSGISENLFMFMRSCFQCGMGSKQFSDALRVRHLERYDKLHLSYLSTLAKVKEMSEWRGTKFKSFLPFEDDSANGYHGFVPSSQWLRDLFDRFIELHAFDFDQAIAVLSALICAIDHSFKLAKHIAKVNGEQIFIALLTITNEKGKIRVYNMTDKAFLEGCFSSLHESVIAVEKYSHLHALEIPEHICINVIRSESAINEVCRAILQDLSEDEFNGDKLVLFVDSEWNVEISDRGYVTGRGATAILQIAYKDQIYVIQISQMLAGNGLPVQLKNILLNPQILKVGRAVSGDLKYLQETCQSTDPFVGAIDLAQLAKDRLVVPSAKVGLADLAWDNELSEAQIRYASLDVYACRCIYDSLIKIPVPSPLPDPVLLGTPVLLFHDNRTRLVARGTILSLEGSYEDINLTRTRCVIEVTEVVVPAAVITTHKCTALGEFGPPPFKAVCLRSHLRLASDHNLPSVAAPVRPLQSTSNLPPLASPDNVDNEPGFGVLLSQEFESTGAHDPNALRDHESDPESQREGSQVLAEALHDWGVWKTVIRSRVIKDAFHIFNMFYISVVHGLRVEFARALRDAIFIPDATDKARIWLWRRCKRIIPPPEELYPLVAKVFEIFGHLKDAKTGLPLFNSAAWAVAKNVLELIQKGFLSDPPGISLYYLVGYDKNGLPLYRCARGTNFTEGGVHTWLRSRLPTSGASVRHINAALKDFILRHNLVVGTFNSTGRRFTGHYSIWLTNEIQELLSYLEDVLKDARPLVGWVNGNLYQPTNEVTGVLPIPEDIRLNSGMARFEPSLDSKRLHHHLASLQGTRKAVLPIHNTTEKDLFRTLMSGQDTLGNFSSATQVEKAVRIWNAHADTKDDIYYKLAEQLKVYYSGDWQTSTNVKQTKAVTSSIRAPLMKQIHDPRRLQMAPPVPEMTLQPHFAASGATTGSLF